MSEVISFRLNKSNPRESQALEVLSRWVTQGYSLRFVITKALLEMDHPGADLETRQGGHDWDSVFGQFRQFIEILKENHLDPLTGSNHDMELPTLPENVLASIKQGVKPGIKPD